MQLIWLTSVRQLPCFHHTHTCIILLQYIHAIMGKLNQNAHESTNIIIVGGLPLLKPGAHVGMFLQGLQPLPEFFIVSTSNIHQLINSMSLIQIRNVTWYLWTIGKDNILLMFILCMYGTFSFYYV